MKFVLDHANALYVAVGAASAQTGAMDATKKYLFTCTVPCLMTQGANPTASAGNGSTAVAAAEEIIVNPALGAKVAVIQASAGGHATLTPILNIVR